MALSWQRKFEDLQQQFVALRRDLLNGNCRTGTPLNIRNGWWLVVLDTELAQGGTATAEILQWSITDNEWQRSGTTIEVQDWQLNLGETVPTGTKARASWYRNVWVLENPYCAASDTLPDETMGSESGELLTTEAGAILITE
jgi:hypothetical protein